MSNAPFGSVGDERVRNIAIRTLLVFGNDPPYLHRQNGGRYPPGRGCSGSRYDGFGATTGALFAAVGATRRALFRDDLQG